MVWHETAPVPPGDAVKYLGELLELRGTPLSEIFLENAKRNHRAYGASTKYGRIWIAVSLAGWSIFFSPPGAIGFISLWDWEECVEGKPPPKGGVLSVEKSVEWILEILNEEVVCEIDSETIERMAQAREKRRLRNRWLKPLEMIAILLVFFGVLAWAVATESMGGIVCAGVILPKVIQATLEMLGFKFPKPKI